MHMQDFRNRVVNPWKVPFYPSFCSVFGQKKLFIVDRPIMKDVCLLLMKISKPDDVVRLHFIPVVYVLESLPVEEQRQVLFILEKNYGTA